MDRNEYKDFRFYDLIHQVIGLLHTMGQYTSRTAMADDDEIGETVMDVREKLESIAENL